jgi:hypothetical protein
LEISGPDPSSLVVKALLAAIMKVIERHPDVRDEMVLALDQFRLSDPEQRSDIGHWSGTE